MTAFQEAMLGWQAFVAVWLVAGHYLVLHGWGARLSAWQHRYVPPEPTAHAHWEQSWTRGTRARVYAMGLASVLMLAGAWAAGVPLGLAVTAAAEVAALYFTRRSQRRAAQSRRAGT